MKNRIKELCKALNTSGRAFSLSIGQSEAWSRTIGKSISSDVIVNILTVYPSINIHWLVMGEGEVFLEGDSTNSNQAPLNTIINNDYKLICDELRHDNKSLRDENKSLRDLLLKEMQKNQELMIENTQLKLKSSTL